MRFGMVPMAKFIHGELEYDTAFNAFPALKTTYDLYIAWFFHTEPAALIKAVNVAQSNLGPEERKAYLSEIRRILTAVYRKDQIQPIILSLGEGITPLYVSLVFPEYNEWWTAYYIENFLAKWMKSNITQIKLFKTQAERDAFAEQIKGFLKKYGSDNWQELVPPELAADFTLKFFAKEITEIQAADAAAIISKNKKMVFIGAAALIGIVGLTTLIKKK